MEGDILHGSVHSASIHRTMNRCDSALEKASKSTLAPKSLYRAIITDGMMLVERLISLSLRAIICLISCPAGCFHVLMLSKNKQETNKLFKLT